MARGRVGDVVFTRKNGQQVARVRNRQPANPRTNAQLYQRALMATVMQAYSAGKAIFDHSFEGYKVGSDNQGRFMSLNTKKLRAAIAADVANGMTGLGCAARIIGPGVVYPVPWTYQVSEGSLTQDIFNPDGSMRHIGEVADETVAQYFIRMGIQRDDIFTAVFFACALNDAGGNIVFHTQGAGDEFGEQTLCQFAFARLRVKEDALTSSTPITASLTFDNLFYLDLESNYVTDLSTHAIGSPLLVASELPYGVDLMTSGVIRSRDNQDLRSTCTLVWPNEDAADYGLTTDYLIAAWSQGAAAIAESDLILEGGAVRRAPANSSNQVKVTANDGTQHTVVSLAVGAASGSTGYNYVQLVTTDGRRLYLLGNAVRSLAYSFLLGVRDGDSVANAWVVKDSSFVIPDSEIVNYYADEEDFGPISSILQFLLRNGVPSDIAVTNSTGRS